MVACNGWSIASMVLANQVHVSTHASQRSSVVSAHTTALVLLASHPVRTHGGRGTAAEVPRPQRKSSRSAASTSSTNMTEPASHHEL
jgi:hypothetical protein